ncbi:hypothetical protein Dsin_012109 [Dipteronia sinensis]|uniref:Reverse transcriptase zinc-binding domain-containing protein n=1 Tax=Dipteronia sinensis TaxID=43782 RepID=A0AAE0E7V5_9ROSI|nr:hypothetical protein Dsin_012109 [Dipteronia sinensis]
MQLIKLSSEVCKKLDRISRNFLWGHTIDKKVVHLLYWDVVCLPKKCGGLGLKKAKALNQAFLAKASWFLIQDDSGIWCKVIKHKYLNTRSLFDIELNKKVVCYSTWKAIAFGASLINKGLFWRVGNGDHIRFRTNNWVPDVGFLLEHALVVLSEEMMCHTVSCFLVDGEWDIRRLALFLPWSIIHRISSIYSVVEDIAHLLWDCKISMAIWDSVFRGVPLFAVVDGDLENWFMKNLKNESTAFDKVPFCLLFPAVVWFIWKWRCKTVFVPDFAIPQDPSQYIHRFCCDWINANSDITVTDSFLVSIGWSPPSVGWVKLNVDGGCNINSGTISSSGVLRDHSKNWLKGFALNRGAGSALEVELWGLLKGLPWLGTLDLGELLWRLTLSLLFIFSVQTYLSIILCSALLRTALHLWLRIGAVF